MQHTITASRLTAIEAAVLECVVYGDLFDYPLTPEEILHWLGCPATAVDVDTALQGSALAPLLSQSTPYVTLAGREALTATRERRRISSAGLRRRAERYGGLIARLPFVRMVAITGSLAVDNAEDGEDLDYLIVTAPGRVWLTRAMIMAIGRVAALRGATLCPNYLLSESALALPANDYYTARELLQMQPIAGHSVYHRMLAANAWWRDHMPNAEPVPSAHPEALEAPEALEGQAAMEPHSLEAGTTLSPSPRKERGPGGEDTPSADPETLEGPTPAMADATRTGTTLSPSPRKERGPGGEVPPQPVSPSLLRRAAEWSLRLPPFDAVERWILAHKGAELRRDASDEAVYDETMCKGHADRWRERTRRRLEERMRQVLEASS